MLYLIESEAAEGVAVGLSTDQMVSVMENIVLPTYKMLVEGERNKKYMGGQKAGRRAFAILADFPSHEEANKWVTSLPYWTFYKVDITPIVPFQNQLDAANRLLQNVKAMPKN